MESWANECGPETCLRSPFAKCAIRTRRLFQQRQSLCKRSACPLAALRRSSGKGTPSPSPVIKRHRVLKMMFHACELQCHGKACVRPTDGSKLRKIRVSTGGDMAFPQISPIALWLMTFIASVKRSGDAPCNRISSDTVSLLLREVI